MSEYRVSMPSGKGLSIGPVPRLLCWLFGHHWEGEVWLEKFEFGGMFNKQIRLKVPSRFCTRCMLRAVLEKDIDWNILEFSAREFDRDFH